MGLPWVFATSEIKATNLGAKIVECTGTLDQDSEVLSSDPNSATDVLCELGQVN